MRPLDEIDFKKRAWVPESGWPFEKSHLEEFYKRAQKLCGIEPADFKIDNWDNQNDRRCLPFNKYLIKTVLFKFTKKSDFIDHHLQHISRAKNIKIYIHANVVEIIPDEAANSISSIRIANLAGKTFSVKSKFYIIAAGALETARLLLASNKKLINGIGNEYDIVGRYFMEHPHCRIGFTVPKSEEIYQLTKFYNKVQYVNNIPVIAKIALTANSLTNHNLLNQVIDLSPKIISRAKINRYPLVNSSGVEALKIIKRHGFKFNHFTENFSVAIKDIDNILLALYRKIKTRFFMKFDKSVINTFYLLSVSEQVPNSNSRVILSNEKDALGTHRIKLDWRLTSQDIKSMHKTMNLMDREFQRLGLGKIIIRIYEHLPNDGIRGGWHHLGTTRMHNSPKKGVVDANCKIHNINNLFIAGPSVFPTGGYANPSLTIVALSIRLADYVKAKFKEVGL
jgi:choline dehydrogenase-like flavoprotein